MIRKDNETIRNEKNNNDSTNNKQCDETQARSCELIKKGKISSVTTFHLTWNINL